MERLHCVALPTDILKSEGHDADKAYELTSQRDAVRRPRSQTNAELSNAKGNFGARNPIIHSRSNLHLQ